MVINWYGEGSFKVQSGQSVIMTDPFESASGLTPPRFKSDVILKTGAPEKYESDKEFEAKNIIGPGEYEVKEIEIKGYQAGMGAVYAVKIEDMKLGFLGGLESAELGAPAMEALRNCDILFAPCGGAPYLDGVLAAKLVKKLEPKIVIPAFFKIKGLKRSAADTKDLEKAMGQKVEEQEKLTIKAKDIIWEGTKIITLKV